MRIDLYSSRNKAWYEEEKEIPISLNLKNGETASISIKRKCLEACKEDAEFGIRYRESCCEKCG